MCGILGFATSKPSADNLKYLKKILYLSAIRGTDATGIAYFKEGKIIIEKDAVDANKFIKELLPKHEEDLTKINIAIGHTRTPTIGTPTDNANNHPLESSNWVLIHNGSVRGLEKLKDYKYKGEVDSEVLLSYVQTYGLEKGLPHVGKTGTAAVALLNKEEPNTIYLWRETNPIKLAYDEASETLFFASQEDFLFKSLTNKLQLFSTFQVRDLPENLLIKITVNPLDIKAINYVEVTSSLTKNYNTDYKGGAYAAGYTKNYLGNNNPSLSLGLIFNETTKRWEKKTEVGLDEKALLQLGYTSIEIQRMTLSTKTIILEKGLPGADVKINHDGSMIIYDDLSHAGTATSVNLPMKTSTQLINKYYIRGISKDFKGWFKLTSPNRGYISYDGELIKKWDKNCGQHYVIALVDAIREKLIDDIALQADVEEMLGLDELYEKNNVPKELMS